MKINLFLFLYLLFTFSVFSQMQAANWYFGDKGEIRFPFGNLPLDTHQNNSSMITKHGSSSYSDINGNLIIYTNGNKIFNKYHQEILPIGFSILGNNESTQSSIIVPYPGNLNKFLLFVTQSMDIYAPLNRIDESINLGFNYYIIDLSENNGLGNIIRPENNELLNRSSQKISGTIHSNGQDFWVVTHYLNKFYSYLITENGISEPVVSITNYTSPFIGYYANAKGQMKFSTKSNKLVVAHQNNVIVEMVNPDNLDVAPRFSEETNESHIHPGKLYIYDFDNTTGKITNEYLVENRNIFVYNGVEFSPSGKYLYYQGANDFVNKIFQFNTENNYKHELFDYSNLSNKNRIGDLQLGVNGKIYFSNRNSTYLSTINFPEKDKNEAEFINNQIPINRNAINKNGLPNFLSNYLKEELKVLNSFDGVNACVNTPLKFWINNNQPIIDINWNFGDGNTSNEEIPTHSYSSSGTYLITVVINGKNYQKTITVHEPINIPYFEMIVCDSDGDGEIGFNLQNFIDFVGEEAISISFHSTRNEAENNQNQLQNFIIRATNSTPNIWARITNKGGCISYTEINFTINSSQLINDSKSICLEIKNNIFVLTKERIQELYSQPITIFNTHQEADLFQNEIINPIIINDNQNSITLYIRQHNLLDCDSVYRVEFQLKKPTFFQLEDQSICPFNGSINYQIPENITAQHIQWNGLQGDDLNQNLNSSSIQITHPGEYSLTITNQNGCSFTDNFTVTASETINVITSINQTSTFKIDYLENNPNNYLFSLDEGLTWNEGNIYNNLPIGNFTLWIKEKNNSQCIVYEEIIKNNKLTNFFSPNGDGINDLWRINGFEKYEWIDVLIYNRYGKEIVKKRINYSNILWDGRNNGKIMSSNSYWYKLTTSTNDTFEGYVVINNSN